MEGRGCYRPVDEWDILRGLHFPRITKEEQRQMNGLFIRYGFYQNEREGRRLTVSCCRRTVTLPWIARTMTPNDRRLRSAGHNDEALCPFCGRTVIMKEIGRLGKRQKVLEYQPVVFLKARRGKLYAVGGWAMKDYQGELEEAATFKVTSLYRFSPGEAVQWADVSFGGVSKKRLTGNYDPVHRIITEPVSRWSGWSESYCGYHVIGMDAIGESGFRYCQYELWRRGDPSEADWHLMTYLSICSVWPRNVEMLVKSGMGRFVDDLIYGRRKNAAAIRWGETDPRRALGLDGEELRAFMRTDRSPELLTVYKKMRALGEADFAKAEAVQDALAGEAGAFLAECRRRKLRPWRTFRYLEKQAPQRRGGGTDTYRAWTEWKDYLDMCRSLGYDLGDGAVLLPGSLARKHDEAAAEQNRRMKIELAKQEKEKAAAFEESLKARREKYNFRLGGLFIRVAEGPEEIVQEGKRLKHCVGGYAARHVEGKLTILFMCEAGAPDTPMVTVEMQGNRMIQAHGFQNERDGSRPPRERYAAFFSTWLSWVEAGSPRDETGAPRLKKSRKGEKAS